MSDGTKVCKKCGKELPLSEFPTFKDKGVIRYRGDCKVCLAKYKQKNYTENKDVYLAKAKENKDEKNAKRRANYAKKDKDEVNEKRRKEYEKNKEHINEIRKEYREENKEKINEQKREWYRDNSEQISEKRREKYINDSKFSNSVKDRASLWYEANKDKALTKHRTYYKDNKEVILKQVAGYRKTLKGKEVAKKAKARRRQLGFNPINNIFEGSEYHHLMCKKESGECDKCIGLFIPFQLHKSVFHDGNKGHNMDKMNKLALEWYISNTPKSKIKSSVYELCKLYNVNTN